MYVYRIRNFNEELKKYHDLSSRVDSFCSTLATSNLVCAQEKFSWIHSYLKRKEGNFRIIAKLIKIERETIICFLKIYSRGEPNYRHFLEEVKHKDDLFAESNLIPQLRSWLAQQKNQNYQFTPNILENSLRIWLQRPDWKIASHDIVIHESEIWYQNFSQQKVREKATIYRQIIEELVNKIIEKVSVGMETNWSNILYYGKDNFYIIYSDISFQDSTKEKVLLLISPILGLPKAAEIERILEPFVGKNSSATEQQDRIIPSDNISLSWWQKRHNLILDDLITYTRRSYPWYLISDEKFWLRIQDGNRVNLALSEEEKDLLHSVSTEKSLPLFLNGRAGSGKSTMLFYLFAYYCYLHLQVCRQREENVFAKPHPLFLTYSPNLSDFAKVKVQSILKHHHHFLEETSPLEKVPNLSSFFKSFRHFLLKLLPASEKANFTEENHVSFHRFRNLLDSRWQNISPEKCWVVIQNFIKGYELIHKDLYLVSTERYQQIPKKEQTVTTEEFITIRDRVWSWYYKYTQEHNLWDDRDLVRTVLDLRCYKPEYTVIFCDEAQDFTRLELQLIMGLSIFSLYNLEQENIFSLPFAFAGDPLQTLNPTGFRWAGFKAAFHDEILAPLGLKSQSQIKLELQQLKYNYRSAAAIVRVNNLIQLWRKLLFEFSDIEPQKAKKYNNFIPQKFIIDNNVKVKDLQNTIKDSIILIPCDEGAEKEFIAQDNLLSALYSEITTETSWNILSAIAAKGLEFKQVILYRFGEACNLNLEDDNPLTTEEDKYFLNKLYVAASRATEKLFIIDTFEGEIKLWSYASDRECLNRFLAKIDNQIIKQQWQQNIELITLGTSLSNINHDFEADALTFETVGINTENINLLIRAIAAYQKSQNKQKVDYCLAWKYRLEHNFNQAGELFFKLNKISEAWECFWQAKNWQRLQQLVIKSKNYSNQETDYFLLLSPVIDYMVQAKDNLEKKSLNIELQNVIQLTDFLATELQQNLAEVQDTKAWQSVLDTYLNQLRQLIANPLTITPNTWFKIASVLINYENDTTTQVKNLIAQCFYWSQNYHRAIEYWEDIDDLTDISADELKNYYIAKAKITQLPQGLQYLYQGKQYFLIIKLWLKSGAKSNANWLKYVAPAFEEIEQYHNALIIYCQLNNVEKVQQCWSKLKNNSPTFLQLKQVLKYYIQRKYWDRAIDFVRQETSFVKLKYYFIYSLAQSQLTAEALTKEQRQNYQKFIEENILNNSQWQQYLNVEHIGITLEKIGSFIATLSFYEQYTYSEDRQIKQFARDRWVATKQRQVDYFRSGVKLTKVQKSQQQLTLNAEKWQIDPALVSSQSLKTQIERLKLSRNAIVKTKTANSRLAQKSQKSQNPTLKTSITVTGLPPQTRLKTLAKGIQQIQIDHLLLRLAEATQQLAIIDLLSNKAIHFDWQKGKVQIDTTTLTVSLKQPLSLTDTQGQYQATLWRDVNPRLELKLENYSEIITINFSTL